MSDFKPKKRITCPACYGVGSTQNIAMGVVMGDLLGTGYMPQTQLCMRCSGTGQVDES